MNLVMPKLGLTMTQAALQSWLVQEGDAVQPGDVLFLFESEKATMEYESPTAGVMGKLLVAEGETVPCGTPVATLLPAGAASTAAVLPEQDRVPGALIATPAARRLARELNVDLAGVAGRGPAGRIQAVDVEAAAQLPASLLAAPLLAAPLLAAPLLAAPLPLATQEVQPAVTPVARRLAADLGLDLAGVHPAAGGRITREDVLALARARIAGASPAKPPAPATSPYAAVELLQGIRRVIAQRMGESAFRAPHVTIHSEVDAGAFAAARRQLNEAQAGIRFSVNALLIAMAGRALRDFPRLNACMVGDEVCIYREVNIALAVETDRGLVAPVVRDADYLPLAAIQARCDELIRRARQGASLPDDLTGGTFTLSNLGAYDVDAFTPIINQPQAAILGVGRMVEKPVVVDGQLIAGTRVTLSLSFDHRILDGALAARFLQRFGQLMQRPMALIL